MEIVIIFVNHSVWFLTVFKDIIRSAVHSLEASGDLKRFLYSFSFTEIN